MDKTKKCDGHYKRLGNLFLHSFLPILSQLPFPTNHRQQHLVYLHSVHVKIFITVKEVIKLSFNFHLKLFHIKPPFKVVFVTFKSANFIIIFCTYGLQLSWNNILSECHGIYSLTDKSSIILFSHHISERKFIIKSKIIIWMVKFKVR